MMMSPAIAATVSSVSSSSGVGVGGHQMCSLFRGALTFPVFRMKLFRYLASNYFVVVVVGYYVLNIMFWLFFAGDEGYYSGSGSGGGDPFQPEHSPKLMFVEDFYNQQ